MNNTTIFRYSFVFLVMLLMSCSMDWDKFSTSNLPHWTTEIEVPLFSTTFFFHSLAEEDTTINVIPFGNNGDSIFAFEMSIDIDSIKVGDKLFQVKIKRLKLVIVCH